MFHGQLTSPPDRHRTAAAHWKRCAKSIRKFMMRFGPKKNAEGYPKKRWYGGCENVDTAEQLAIDRALRLFGAEHANVQPHSGAQANMAVYFSMLKPGDKILAMN